LPPLLARARYPIAFLSTLVALALCLAPAGAAAKRKVPFGFMGVNLTPAATGPHVLTAGQLDKQFANMARNGVESARTDFRWFAANPQAGVYDWTLTDPVVAAAARHGISLLPTVQLTPRWASSKPNNDNWLRAAPRRPSLIAPFMKALVHRYGPKGSFWRQNRTLPKRPIREWQIWNEPELHQYWISRYPKDFLPVFRAAANAVHSADRHAKVALPALAGELNPTLRAWQELEAYYKAGLKKQFDIVSLDQYVTGQKVSARVSAHRLAETVLFMHRVSLVHHDPKAPIYLTEFGWPAPPKSFPKSLRQGTEVTPAGQRARLSAFYRRMARGPRFGLKRAYWFTWATPYASGTIATAFNYMGLYQWTVGAGNPFKPQKLLAAYKKTARALEGCRKGANAKRCR
jgi:hypothetical protein